MYKRQFQNRKVGLIENGTWAPSAGRVMKGYLEEMKNIQVCDTMVTIRSTMKPEDREAMERLADELLAQ